ncbi:MAG: LLM class flavin-dependent oxidoreductase [Streptosporangiales bacterium]|nr:LLM class flavin-dependent oxidoreductase [Streptosporangiales bacterium]
MTAVELGYFVNPEYEKGVDVRRATEEQRETVRLCHQLGLRAVIVGEHFSRQDSVWLPPLHLLGRICDQGEGMLFGTGVLAAPLHNPVVLAEQAAYLDGLTEGNFALGLSAGWNAHEFASLSVPMAGRGQAVHETVEILRALWRTEGPVSYAGSRYSVTDVELGLRPVSQGGPPIWLGASSPRALRRAAQLGDAWLATSHLPPGDVATQAEQYRTYLSEAGRTLPATRPGLRNIYVGRTMESAIRDAGPYLTSSYSMFDSWGLFAEVLDQAGDAVDYEKAAQRAVIGDPETVAAQLVDFVGASDVNLLLARTQWLGMDHRNIMASLELLATEVMPRVNSALGQGER